jgi:hypothetical protein
MNDKDRIPASTRAVLAAFVAPWFLFLIVPFGVLFSLPLSFVLFVRRSRRTAFLLILLSPCVLIPAAGLAWGIGTYGRGTAHLWMAGMPSPEYRNKVDRETGCPWRSSGCVVTGREPFWQEPNNLALRILSRIAGPLRPAEK